MRNRVASVGWLAAALALLLMPLPSGRTLIADTIENVCHPLLFAGVAIVVLRMLRAWAPTWPVPRLYVTTLVATSAFGFASEFLQLVTGRDATVEDAVNDVIGTLLGLALHALRDRSAAAGPARPAVRRAAIALAVAAGIGAVLPLGLTWAAYRERDSWLPELLRMDSPTAAKFINLHDVNVRTAPHGSLDLRFAVHATWPRITLTEPYPNWSAFRSLVITVRNLEPRPLAIGVRIDDRIGPQDDGDFVDAEYVVPADARRELRIDLGTARNLATGRPLDVARILKLALYAGKLTESRTARLESVRLER